MKRRAVRAATAIAAVSAVAAGCSLSDGDGGTQQTPTVTLVTHDSFLAPQEVLDAFQKQSGIKVSVLKQGDAGSLSHKLVLTKANPVADVADQKARADEGPPSRRRRARCRLDLRFARAQGGRLRPVPQPGGRSRAA